jgi:FKBP-type peptidyl-prolyl cis-trans isomerase
VAEAWLMLAADQVVEGLDLAILKHNEEEAFEVSLDPEYGFGDREEKRALATVPPNSQLHYTVEILEIQKVCLLILREAMFCG